jgi:hypothetical protein
MGNPTTLVAQRFILQDSRGVVRAALGVNDAGEVLLALMDARGQGRADMGVTAEGLPRFELFDSAGNTRALVNVDEQDTPSLALYDGHKARAVVSVMGQGPYLALADEQSRRQITLGTGPGTAQILFEDVSNPGTCVVGIGADHTVGMAVADPKGETRVEVLLQPDGKAGLMAVQVDGQVSTLP